MVLILECHIRNNYQYRIFTTWQAIPFKRKFYFTSFSRHAYLASTLFRFVLQVFYLLVTKVQGSIIYFLNRGNLVLVYENINVQMA